MKTDPTSPLPPLPNLELLRSGIALVPAPGADAAEWAIYVEVPGSGRPIRSCTCKLSRRRTCNHLRQLSQGVARWQKILAGRSWEAFFSQTVWHQLARLIFEAGPLPCAEIRVHQLASAPLGDAAGTVPDEAETVISGQEQPST